VTKRLATVDGGGPRNELRGFDGEAPRLYHVWFSTKRRRGLLAGDVEIQAKQMLRLIAEDKGIDLRLCETMVDHVHLLLSARPQELSRQVKLLKGISARRLFQQFPDIKLDARIDRFWQRGFGYRATGGGAHDVAWYIGTQKQRTGKYER
jgi:putative transposase